MLIRPSLLVLLTRTLCAADAWLMQNPWAVSPL